MNIKIRKWKIEDAKNLAEALNNKKILDNLRDGLPYPYTESDAEWYIDSIQKENSNYAFAITVDDVAVGSIAVFRQGNIHFRTGELGYYLKEEFWGKGIVTESVRQIVDYIFDNTDIIRIFAEPFSFNKGSCRVLEKNGFECEGLLRSNAVKNGKICDMKLYSIIKKV